MELGGLFKKKPMKTFFTKPFRKMGYSFNSYTKDASSIPSDDNKNKMCVFDIRKL